MMKKIIFLHGFFASGKCEMALTLKEIFQEKVNVLTPDLPLHPQEALDFIHTLCDREHPDLLVGNSCGSFLAQQLAPVLGIPALLGNPHLQMTEFLRERKGKHTYQSPRQNGNQELTIDDELINEFASLENVQFSCCNSFYKDKVWGVFGENDTLAHFEPLFLQHYTNTFHFPGGHTPTAAEVKTWHAPLIEKMLLTYSASNDGYRYFRHFKGGTYRFLRTAFNSETNERMVIYQALYGDKCYWVRPEKNFFESITREGRTFNRFTEIEAPTED